MPSLESLTFWTGVVAVAFTAFAAVAGSFSWYFSTRLSAAKDAASAIFQEESRLAIASANARAAEATTKAAEAGEGAAKALADAAEANKTAEGFRLDIAKANERAAAANATAEKERLARLQLEARLADRVLTEAQQQSIAQQIKSLGSFAVQIFTYADVNEVARIADSISKVAVLAGWAVALAKASGGVIVTGIVFAVSKEAPLEVRTAAARFVSALATSGVSADLTKTPMEDIPGPGMSFGSTLPTPQMRIMIGNK